MSATLTPDAADGMPAGHPAPPVGEGPVERLCKYASEAALIIMLLVIGADIFTRYLLNFSFEIADELGGYMLVVMTFVSLSVCQANNAFHQVELVQARLGPRGRALSGGDLRRAVVWLRVPAAVAARQARVLLLSLRRARADLPGDAAVDSAARDGDRRRGAVLLDRPDVPRPCAALPHAAAA